MLLHSSLYGHGLPAVCVCVSGKPVMVVNGAYRGLRAILEGLDTAKFCVSVRIDQVTLIQLRIHFVTECLLVYT